MIRPRKSEGLLLLALPQLRPPRRPGLNQAVLRPHPPWRYRNIREFEDLLLRSPVPPEEALVFTRHDLETLAMVTLSGLQ